LKYNNDEHSKPFFDNFWPEWEVSAHYAKGDQVDFAFLSDDISFKFTGFERFSFVNPTEYFSIGKVKKFMEEKLNYNDLSFEYEEKEEKIPKCNKLVYKGPKKFYLNIPYPANKIIKKPSERVYDLEDFFNEKVERYKNNYK
jgi:hypothetical protein